MGKYGFLDNFFKRGARHAPTRQVDNVAELAGKRSKKGSFRWMKNMFKKGNKWNKRAAIALALISILSTLFGLVQCWEVIMNATEKYQDPDYEMTFDDIKELFKEIIENCEELKWIIIGIITFILCYIIFIVIALNDDDSGFKIFGIFLIVAGIVSILILSYIVYDYIENELLNNLDLNDLMDPDIEAELISHGHNVSSSISSATSHFDQDYGGDCCGDYVCETPTSPGADADEEDSLTQEELNELLTEFILPEALLIIGVSFSKILGGAGSAILGSSIGGFLAKGVGNSLLGIGILGRILNVVGGLRTSLILGAIDIYDPLNMNSYIDNEKMLIYRNTIDTTVLNDLKSKNPPILPPFVFALDYLKDTHKTENQDLFDYLYDSYKEAYNKLLVVNLNISTNNSSGVLYISNKLDSLINDLSYDSLMDFIYSFSEIYSEPSEEDIKCRILSESGSNSFSEKMNGNPNERDIKLFENTSDILTQKLTDKYKSELSDNLDILKNTIKIESSIYKIINHIQSGLSNRDKLNLYEKNNFYEYFKRTDIFQDLNDIPTFDSISVEVDNFPHEITDTYYTTYITTTLQRELNNEYNYLDQWTDQDDDISYKKEQLKIEISDLQALHEINLGISYINYYSHLSTKHRSGLSLSEEGIRKYREIIYEKINRDESNQTSDDLDFNYTSDNPINISIPTYSKYYRDFKVGTSTAEIAMYKLPFDEPIPQLSVGEIVLGKICRIGEPAVLDISGSNSPRGDGILDSLSESWESRPRAESLHISGNVLFEADTQDKINIGNSIETYNTGLCNYDEPTNFCENQVFISRNDFSIDSYNSSYCGKKIGSDEDVCNFDDTVEECDNTHCVYHVGTQNPPASNYFTDNKIHNCEISNSQRVCEAISGTILCRGSQSVFNDAVAILENPEESADEAVFHLAVADMVISDENLKYDIQRVGRSSSGIPLYRWKYLPGLGFDTKHEYIGTTTQTLLSMGKDYAVIKNGYYNEYSGQYYDLINYSLIPDVKFGIYN